MNEWADYVRHEMEAADFDEFLSAFQTMTGKWSILNLFRKFIT